MDLKGQTGQAEPKPSFALPLGSELFSGNGSLKGLVLMGWAGGVSLAQREVCLTLQFRICKPKCPQKEAMPSNLALIRFIQVLFWLPSADCLVSFLCWFQNLKKEESES